MFDTIFFDRDGIINEVIMRDGIVSSPRKMHEFNFLKDFEEFYEVLLVHNFNLFIVSNQPDVRRGLLSLTELNEMTGLIETKFKFREIRYCMHDETDCCNCRKPRPGMILDLLTRHQLNPNSALLIGDSDKDILAGKSAGVSTAFVRRGYNENKIDADFAVDRLLDLTNQIIP